MDPNLKAAAQKELLKRKARAELERRKMAQPQEAPVTMEGSAKALGTGVAQGAIGLPGGFGDVAQINSDLLSGGAKYLGAPEWAQDAAGVAGKAMMGPLGFMPTTDQITKSVDGVTGPMYEPQNTTEEYLQTGGQFVPAAVAGPGGVARKAAMTLIPSVASETAGQLTEGTEAEPYARFAGALGGGLAAAGRGGNAMKEMRKAAPDLSTVGKQTNAAYAKLRDAGIQFDENAYKSFAMKVAIKLREHGWRPRDGDPITSDLKEIAGRIGKPNDWAEMENLREFVGNLPKNASNKDYARAGIIKDALSDFIDNGKVISTKGVDPKTIAALTKEARELGRKNIIGKKIAKMMDKSEWYLPGEESGLKNQVSTFGKNEGRGLEPAEKQAFKSVIRKEGLNSILSTTGSRAGQVVMGGAALYGGGIPAALLATGGHLGARKLSEINTKKAIAKALSTVLAGRPAQKAALKADKLTAKEIMARRLLAGASGQNYSADH